MNKALLAQVFIATASWHSPTGWHCDRCGVSCGLALDELCFCCVGALHDIEADWVASGGAE